MKRQELAPAKVNLTLDVGARRPDGYHEVVSVMQSVALYDTVTMESGTGAKTTSSVITKLNINANC